MEPTETQVTPRVSPAGHPRTSREHGDRAAATHVRAAARLPRRPARCGSRSSPRLPEDWHVVTYDVRGAGRSTRPPGRVGVPRSRMLVEDLVARARRDRARRGAGAPRGPRLGLGRRLGRGGRRDLGPAAGGPAGVVHLGQRPAAGPPRPRLLAGWRGTAADAAPARCTAGTSWLLPAARAARAHLALRPGADPPRLRRCSTRRRRPAARGDRRCATTPARPSTSTAPTCCRGCAAPLPWRTSVPVQLVVAAPRRVHHPALAGRPRGPLPRPEPRRARRGPLGPPRPARGARRPGRASFVAARTRP